MKRFAVLIAAIAAMAAAALAHARPDERPPAPMLHRTHADSSDIGSSGKYAAVSRTVDISMTDAMRFVPSRIVVHEGETIRFVIKNSGHLKHELVLGTDADLKAHAEMMKRFPNMKHREPNMVTVTPGSVGELVWRFESPGSVAFACLEPGHYDAGMFGMVEVTALEKNQSMTTEIGRARH